MNAPTLIPQLAAPAVAASAVDAHIDRALRGRAPEDVGWVRADPRTLFVPMRAFTAVTDISSYGYDPHTDQVQPIDQQPGDDYLLRLFFSHYPQSPPSGQFVNPETRSYNLATDIPWLPRIEGVNEVCVHSNYDNRGGQLICCSSTLEFYEVNHSLEAKHQWRDGLTFAVLLNTLSRYMRPGTYHGRQTG